MDLFINMYVRFGRYAVATAVLYWRQYSCCRKKKKRNKNGEKSYEIIVRCMADEALVTAL